MKLLSQCSQLLLKVRSYFRCADRDLESEANTVISAIGGLQNIKDIGACATRLRITLYDLNLVNEAALKNHGAFGVVKMGSNHLQIIYGLKANLYAQTINERLERAA